VSETSTGYSFLKVVQLEQDLVGGQNKQRPTENSNLHILGRNVVAGVGDGERGCDWFAEVDDEV
jgi:hypothetical protein